MCLFPARGEFSPLTAIRTIRWHLPDPRLNMNLDASMQTLNSEFCVLNSVLFAVRYCFTSRSGGPPQLNVTAPLNDLTVNRASPPRESASSRPSPRI
jgi:hypothetical protein